MVNSIQKMLNSIPIPGEGLTDELGKFAWQRPPELVSVDEAVLYYTEKMSTQQVKKDISSLLDSNISVRSIAQSLIDQSIYQGLHSIDLGYLVLPVLAEMVMYIGDVNKITYVTGFEETFDNTISDAALTKKVIDNFRKEVKKPSKENEEVKETLEINKEIEQPKGLMARKTITEQMEM